MVNGRPCVSTLSARDRAKIEATIATDVLGCRRHPEIRFESSELGESTVSGRLELCGRSREVTLRRCGDEVEGTVYQPDFGIKPYSAMLGTLKIKPDVRVRVRLRR